jgi:thymidylate synthase
MEHEEFQYLNLIRKILDNGSEEKTRNGTTKVLFGETMRFSLKDGIIPILTTKKTAWKTCLKELLWFIRGSTSNHELKEQKVNIWNQNSSREFLDSRNLDYEEGDLGPIYGFQWRHFNADYKDCHSSYEKQGIDQLYEVINNLKNEETRTSRRLIVSAWNPCQIDKMALPPCHLLFQFHVKQNKYLSCSLYQRSGDVGLGVPFNIASYSFLTHIIAKHCDLIADEFIHFIGNAHIYDDHIDALTEQIKREPKPFPKINIKNKHENIEDYTVDDIEWEEKYEHHDTIFMKMSA